MSENIMLIPAIRISSSGLDAENKRVEVAANNIANAHTTRTIDGKLFQRKEVIFATKLEKAKAGMGVGRQMAGVEIKGIVEDGRGAKQIYMPGHPDANKDGYVSMPDINPVEEMVNMMSATRAYEANLAAVKAARTMAAKALEIGK